MHIRTLERPSLRYHAERGNDENGATLILGIAITVNLLVDEPQTDFPETNKSNPTLHVLNAVENRSLLETPLFQPGRKPIVMPTAPVEPVALPIPAPPPLLVGIIRTGKQRMALLEDRENNISGLTPEGESFGEWHVKRVEEKAAILGHAQDEDLTMPLHPEALSVLAGDQGGGAENETKTPTKPVQQLERPKRKRPATPNADAPEAIPRQMEAFPSQR